ncbi:MAG: phage shock protein A, partial [Paenibacillus sp. RIFOXYA1_FULL_44_5]
TVASLNEMLEQSEDPLRLIDGFLHEQREQIMQSERLYQQVLRHAQTVRRQYLHEQELVEKREKQALLAVKADEEIIARMALQEKMQHEEQAERYKSLYEQSQQQVIELEDRLEQLKQDYQEVQSKRNYYGARLESLRLQQQMNERQRNNGSFMEGRAFNRLEERVSDMEYEAKALRDLRNMTSETLLKAGSRVQQALDLELTKLRNKLEKEGWMKDE